MLSVRDLSFRYRGGAPVLKNVSFDAEDGCSMAILGNNGVGKSTLLKCINRILKADSGSAMLDGTELTALSHGEIAKKVAFVAQSIPNVQLTVEDAVLLGRRPYMKWALADEDRAIAEKAIEKLDLTALRGRYVDRLSGGERQKVMLARALAQQPRVLLLDEPTSNLDLHNQHQVLGEVKQICEETGITALVIIHDLNLALRFCDRFLMLRDGEVDACGGAEIVNRESIERVYRIHAEVAEIGGRRVVLTD